LACRYSPPCFPVCIGVFFLSPRAFFFHPVSLASHTSVLLRSGFPFAVVTFTVRFCCFYSSLSLGSCPLPSQSFFLFFPVFSSFFFFLRSHSVFFLFFPVFLGFLPSFFLFPLSRGASLFFCFFFLDFSPFLPHPLSRAKGPLSAFR